MSIPDRLTIGPHSFAPPLLLAPMAGYSDFAFRMSIRQQGGVGLAYTEMLSPASLLQGKGRRRKALLATSPEEGPLGYQIYGAHAGTLCDAARWLEQQGVQLIDINMGCPQRKISTHGAGAGLLRDPAEAVRIAAEVVKAVRVPVTVKLRLGWTHERLVAEDMVPGLEEAGVAAITIHGRTRSQGYTGEADRTEIRKVVAAARRVPVIGNGDVTSPAAARRMFDETGCAAIMLGRGLLKNPWLIRDIWADFQGLPPPPVPDRAAVVTFALDHFERMVALYGPIGATLLYRKWIPQYLRRLLRDRQHLVDMMLITTAEPMRAAIAELADMRDR